MIYHLALREQAKSILSQRDISWSESIDIGTFQFCYEIWYHLLDKSQKFMSSLTIDWPIQWCRRSWVMVLWVFEQTASLLPWKPVNTSPDIEWLLCGGRGLGMNGLLLMCWHAILYHMVTTYTPFTNSIMWIISALFGCKIGTGPE